MLTAFCAEADGDNDDNDDDESPWKCQITGRSSDEPAVNTAMSRRGAIKQYSMVRSRLHAMGTRTNKAAAVEIGLAWLGRASPSLA